MSVDSRIQMLANVTNRRQSRRIMDLGDDSALRLEWPNGREWVATNTDAGLYLVGYAAAGGLYMARLVEPGTLSLNADRDCVDVDVIRDPPAAVKRARARYRDDGGDDE